MKSILGHVVVSEPNFDAATECPDCGFDAFLAFPIHVITSEGVRPFGTYGACTRCHEELGNER